MEDQFGVDEQTRLRQGSPVSHSRREGVRPLDLAEDERPDGIVLRREQHYGLDVTSKVIVEIEDGERNITPFGDHGANSGAVRVYKRSQSVPFARAVPGDTIHVRAVTEHCDAYNGDDEPYFGEQDLVSLVPDIGSVDGVRLCPTADVDDRHNSMCIGLVDEMSMHKTSKEGHGELIEVTFDPSIEE